MDPRKILIVGATGIVGRAATEHFRSLPNWQTVTLSRRAPDGEAAQRHVALDLTDRAACVRAAPALASVTDVLYSALYEKPDLVAGWRDAGQIEVNVEMLRNLLDALDLAKGDLKHVTILQGTKAYGLHDVQIPVPAKERWPRAPHNVFYWPQEDLLRERQLRSNWAFTILRPQLILGNAVGSPMNVIAAIGVYATIMREMRRPLCFPGGGRYVHAASDSRLIARAAEFAATRQPPASDTYNVVNGDMLVWQDVWGAIAAHFNMEAGEAKPLNLSSEMPSFESVWADIAARHNLRCRSMKDLLGSSWQFTDRTFNYGIEAPLDRIVSPIKLLQAGFRGCADTEDSIIYWLSRMQSAGFLPR